MKETQHKNKNTVRKFLFLSFLSVGFVFLLNSCDSRNQKADAEVDERYQQDFEEIYKLIYEDPALAREKSREILDGLVAEDKKPRIKSLKYIGSSYALETKYPEAIKYYNEALGLAEEIEDHFEMGNLNNNLGTIYNEFGNYNSAYIYFITALDQYDLAGNKEKRSGTLNNIGLTYLNLGNFEKALSYFEQALETMEIRDPIMRSTILNNIAICKVNLKEIKEAMEILDRSIELSEQANNQYGLCISYQIKGNFLLAEEKKEEAFTAYQKSLQIAENADLFHQTAVSKTGIARVLLNQNKSDEALKIAEEVMKMADEKNSLVLQTDAHRLLASIYQTKGKFEKSLLHFQKHIEVKEELNNNSVVNQIYDVELNHLNQLNKMQQLELDKKELAIRNKNNLLFFVSSLFLLGLAGLYLAYRNHRNKQKVKLQSTILELTKKKSNAAMEAEIVERKRIGRELHDSLGYLLSLAGLNASVLQKRKDISEEKKAELLNSLMESIDDAFEEVRNISHNLAPSLLSEQGLKGALKSIADRVNQSNKLKMSFETFGLNQKPDGLTENVLYRTIQEIVNNTIKHAEAGELFIQIAQDTNQITLLAEDNGKGFDVNQLKTGSSFGLSHIKSWVENLNGNIHIDSKTGRGTIISILIPKEKTA